MFSFVYILAFLTFILRIFKQNALFVFCLIYVFVSKQFKPFKSIQIKRFYLIVLADLDFILNESLSIYLELTNKM